MKPLAHILVVDDDEVLRGLMCNTLEALGYSEIVTAVNGRDAMPHLLQEEFDAVFSDVDMPEMDGLSLLEWIRTGLYQTKTPVFLVTSRDDALVHQQAKDYDALVIAKPFSMKTVLQALEKANL